MGASINLWRAFVGAYQQHARSQQSWRQLLLVDLPFVDIPFGIAFALMARNAGDERAVYIACGALFFQVWSWGVNTIGWKIDAEAWDGTLDAVLVSRTPLMVVCLGKGATEIYISGCRGLVGLLTVLAVSGASLPLDRLPLMLMAGVVALWTVLVMGITFAPLVVLIGGREGIFYSISALGLVLNGFFAPILSLPSDLQAVAHLLPTAWATDGLWRAIQGGGSAEVLPPVAIALAMSAAAAVLANLLFGRVEQRIRTTGQARA